MDAAPRPIGLAPRRLAVWHLPFAHEYDMT